MGRGKKILRFVGAGALTGFSALAAGLIVIGGVMVLTGQLGWHKQVFKMPEYGSLIIQDDETAWDSPNGPYYIWEVLDTAGDVVRTPNSLAVPSEGGEETFEFVRVPGTTIVGVVVESRPDRLILMYEFSSNKAWPGSFEVQEGTASERMLEELRAAFPERDLKPAYEPREATERSTGSGL